MSDENEVRCFVCGGVVRTNASEVPCRACGGGELEELKRERDMLKVKHTNALELLRLVQGLLE